MRRAEVEQKADRVIADMADMRHILAESRGTRDRLLRELEELRDNLRRFRDRSRDETDRHDGEAHGDARV